MHILTHIWFAHIQKHITKTHIYVCTYETHIYGDPTDYELSVIYHVGSLWARILTTQCCLGGATPLLCSPQGLFGGDMWTRTKVTTEKPVLALIISVGPTQKEHQKEKITESKNAFGGPKDNV